MTVVTSFKVTSAAQLNAAIAAISLGGTAEASNTAYTITVLSDLTLNAVITSINLGAGSSLSIIGADPGNAGLVAPINGDGTRRGFSVTSGTVSLINLDLVGMHATSGGAAISVANGATVTTTGVNFSADHATRAGGGGILVQQGGALTLDGGRVAGSGTGDAIFLQAGSTITLENGVDVTGPIADMAGAGLGGGAGSVAIIGGVTLAAGNPYTGATVIGPGGATGTLSLQAPGAAGSGTIGFGDAFGDQLIVSSGDLPINVITGFTIGDTIDLQGIGLETAGTIGPGNRLALQGGTLPATLALDPDADYTSNAVVLQSDGATGTRLTMVQNRFSIASEADWNAALSQIDLGGVSSGIDTAYTLALTQSFTLGADMLAIDLAAGDMLTIAGDGQTIDGGNLYRGLFDDVGAVAIDDLTIRDAVATGGAGGSGAAPGGGGGGLGGGLFVAAGGTATLTEVVFSNDQAVGGAGGAYRGSGVGGGGGLGGAGGAGSGIHAGGGGGVGLGATGGSYPASNGGAGILAGAGAGGAGEGAGSGGGGANGGGGGAGGTFSGSGRDPRSFPGPSGSGGSENFGGGAGSGSAAGFGGGGAAYNGAANGSPDPNSGTGGWGGGGAGGGAGGFGAGTSTGGGGGLGAGGAVFVQQGASWSSAAARCRVARRPGEPEPAAAAMVPASVPASLPRAAAIWISRRPAARP